MNKLKITLMAATMLYATTAMHAQTFGDVLNKANKALGGVSTKSSGSSNITNNEAVAGLKEALKIGTQNASGQLSNVNGFFGNQIIKILMPPEAKKVETTLRSVGMGSHVDKAILAMNRAAEDAAGKAVPIFVNAITSMSVQDGISIVRGGNGAATNYLKGRTTTELTNAFRPVIQGSLNKVDATKYWSQVFTIYNKLPTTRSQVNPDLTAYVTERALNGLFVTIADEENKIRTNPAARVTDLLKKVFGMP
jgi:hypothetical protein